MNANNEFSVDWYRSPIDPGLLEALNRRDDLKALALTLGHLSVIALTFTSALLAQAWLAWPWVILAVLLHGSVVKFSINAVHEFVHGTVFTRKWPNRLFMYVYSFLGWLHPHFFWASHTEHHKFTMHPPHDLEVVAPCRISFRHFLLYGIFDRQMVLGPIRQNLSYARGRFSDEGWEGHLLKENTTKREMTIWARVLLAGHALIAIVSLYFGYWLIPLLISFTPAYGGLLQQACNALQHTGLPGEVSDYRLSCRTVRLNPLLEFLYWNMNYHTEHHMYAAVPFYNLKKLHAAIADDLPHTHDGLLSSWRELIAIEHRLGEDPDYRHYRKLPGNEEKQQPDTATSAGERDQAALDSAAPGRLWECTVCGFVYSEALGLPDEGIPPGTSWDDIPDDWMCPDCGMSKADFTMLKR